MVAPLTGDYAPYGDHIRRGIELALDDLRVRGIKAETYYEDACLPAQTRSALSKLVSVNHIDGLAGSYCVIGMVASETILETARIVSFQTSGGTKEIVDAGEYLFTTAARTSSEAHKLAEYSFQNLNARKAAILYLTTQWGEEFQREFSQRFSELGGSITGRETNPIGVSSFRTELTRLRQGNPDVLVIVHLAQTLGIAIRQARESGFQKQILATTDSEEQSVLDAAGDYAEGLQFLVPEPPVDTEPMNRFAAAFRAKFRSDPHPLSRHAYDATILTAQALQECRKDGKCAKDRLYQVHDYSGASGEFSIEPDGGCTRDFSLKTIENGRFVKTPLFVAGH